MRANDPSSKIFYKGASDDFIVFVDDLGSWKNWRNDRSIPLSHVVNGYKIFVTHNHGAQGVLDGASKAMLANEFGTSNEDECIEKILETGEPQMSSQREAQGDTNPRNGPGMMVR